jgi:hypothetical protein
MENICQEITDRFLKPTSNMASLGDISNYQPQLQAGPQELKRFLYIGKMIGWALQQQDFNLSLDLNPIFWKRLC